MVEWSRLGIQLGVICALISICILPYGYGSNNNELLYVCFTSLLFNVFIACVCYYIRWQKTNRKNIFIRNDVRNDVNHENPVIVVVHRPRKVIKSSHHFYIGLNVSKISIFQTCQYLIRLKILLNKFHGKLAQTPFFRHIPFVYKKMILMVHSAFLDFFSMV